MRGVFVIFIAIALLFFCCAITAEEADTTTKPTHTVKFDKDSFFDIVADSIRLINQTFRGDEAAAQPLLAQSGLRALKAWADKNGELAQTTLQPLLSADFQSLTELSELRNAVNNADINWLDAVDALIEAAVHALNDPFSRYFTIEEYRRLIGMIDAGERDLYGLMPQRMANGNISIAQVNFGSPAYYAGLRNEDEILAINGRLVADYERDDLVRTIAPDKPTDLRLIVLRKGWEYPVEFTLYANEELISPVMSEMLTPEIGYVRGIIFGGDMDNMVHSALKRLKAQGANSFILDLRNNPGGNAGIAVNLCDLFLRGQKVATIFKMFNEQYGTAVPMLIPGKPSDFEDSPLVCLINRASASASEMTSGALQDHHRATIIGTTSYGKGCAQVPLGIPASRGTRFLYLTSAKYYLPSGRSIHKTGVFPDIQIQDGHRLSNTNSFALTANWPEAVKFAQKFVKKEPKAAKNLALSEISISSVKGLSSLKKRAAREKWFNSDCFEPAIRHAIIYEYCRQSRIRPALDREDEVVKAAIMRLELESRASKPQISR